LRTKKRNMVDIIKKNIKISILLEKMSKKLEIAEKEKKFI